MCLLNYLNKLELFIIDFIILQCYPPQRIKALAYRISYTEHCMLHCIWIIQCDILYILYWISYTVNKQYIIYTVYHIQYIVYYHVQYIIYYGRNIYWSQVKKDNLSKRISQLMRKSISLYFSKPANRRECTMDKFILKLIVIFSGILTGNASWKSWDFSRIWPDILDS